ncbi:uncharacterized protein LOC143898680 isoform X1 [Temnothorax americanus]|uniref:uncharacterized protein LOC143898680 isoform X1 n=1 Tax=Temnothorax americanus TaxID=1964332 RepID=UPI0040677F9C
MTNIEAFWTAMQAAHEEHKCYIKHRNIKEFVIIRFVFSAERSHLTIIIMADEWTINILKKWEFSSYEAIFKEHEIDKNSFLKLKEEHIRLLIPLFGPQVKFLNLWTNLVSSSMKVENAVDLEDRAIETINAVVAADGSLLEELIVAIPEEQKVDEELQVNEEFPTDPLSIEIEVSQSQQTKRCKKNSLNENRKSTCVSNDVRFYLERTSDGKSYFGLYKNQGFDNALRSDLAKYIVTAELASDPNKRITSDDFKRLSQQIIELFPTEIVDTWYIPRRKKTTGTDRAVQPKGKLYDQYTKLIGKLRKAELRSGNLQEEEQDVNDSHDFNGTGSSETQLDNLQWLRRCLEPQNEAIIKWKETASIRLLKLRNTEYRQKKGKHFIGAITDYFNEFRILRQPWGYILLEQDFSYLYPNHSMQLLSNWEKIVQRIKSLLKTNIISSTPEEETVEVLLAIPTLFSPKNVGRWRPTAADLSAGFLLHIKALRDLEVQVERMRQKLFAAKKQLQPFPVIIGENTANITESYVYIDNFPYKVESPLRAIDVCFKAYQALHASYPFQSSQPWLFLQQAIYQLKTQWDEHVPSVATLVNEYLQLTDD